MSIFHAKKRGHRIAVFHRGVFNFSDPVVLSQQAWIEHIAEVADWDGKIVILPDDQLLPALRLPYNFAQDWSIDASHIRETTGFSDPFTLKESLRISKVHF
jgi:hypothetical protein